MPWVIRNKRGEYLQRLLGSRSSAKRTWVSSMDEATTWIKPGAARNASKLAPQAHSIQEVRLMLWGSPTPLKTHV